MSNFKEKLIPPDTEYLIQYLEEVYPTKVFQPDTSRSVIDFHMGKRDLIETLKRKWMKQNTSNP